MKVPPMALEPPAAAVHAGLASIAPRDKAEILAEALPYIRKYHGKTLVIKYGGLSLIHI